MDASQDTWPLKPGDLYSFLCQDTTTMFAKLPVAIKVEDGGVQYLAKIEVVNGQLWLTTRTDAVDLTVP